MTTTTATLLREALNLPADERVALVEGLLSSLDQPDPELDALWLHEVETRLAAYHAGELPATDAEQVFAELDQDL